jgi:hypothetical protein
MLFQRKETIVYRSRIQTLEESHRVLDKQITEGNYTDEQISEMKKRKLMLKDEIARLTKLQWIEDHERVDFDDDR